MLLPQCVYRAVNDYNRLRNAQGGLPLTVGCTLSADYASVAGRTRGLEDKLQALSDSCAISAENEFSAVADTVG